MNLFVLFNLCAFISLATSALGEENTTCNSSCTTLLARSNDSHRVINALLDEIINEVTKLEDEEAHAHNYTKLTLFVLLLLLVIFIKLKFARLSGWFKSRRKPTTDNITIQELNYNVVDSNEHASQPVLVRSN